METKKVKIPEMLEKLNEIYAKQDAIILKSKLMLLNGDNNIKNNEVLYNQLEEDKEFIQTMIMYASNKNG